MFRKFIVFIVLTTLSCTKKPVTVFVNTNFVTNNKVVLDDAFITSSNNGKRYSNILLNPGKHTVSINDKSKEEFIVKGIDGILNVAHEEFVILPIDFRTGKTIKSMNIPLPVVYDSLVVYHNSVGVNQSEIIKVLKTSAFEYILSSSGGGRIDKDNLFIRKSWSFGIDEEIPSTISVKRPSDWDLETKTKLVHANSFFMFAKSSEDYHIELIENPELIKLVASFLK